MNQAIKRRSQKGDSKIGCLFWLVIAAFVGYALWQVVPVKVQSVELKNFMTNQSERTGRGDRALKRLRSDILDRAEELEIPLNPENLKIKQSSRKTTVECSYTVPIELIFYTWDWKINLSSETPMFDTS